MTKSRNLRIGEGLIRPQPAFGVWMDLSSRHGYIFLATRHYNFKVEPKLIVEIDTRFFDLNGNFIDWSWHHVDGHFGSIQP